MKERLKRFRAIAAISGIWPFLKPEGALLLYAAAVTLLLTVAEIVAPVLLGMSLDSLLGNVPDEKSSMFAALGWNGLVAVLLADAALAGILIAHQGKLSGRIGQRVAARMRDALWEH